MEYVFVLGIDYDVDGTSLSGIFTDERKAGEAFKKLEEDASFGEPKIFKVKLDEYLGFDFHFN